MQFDNWNAGTMGSWNIGSFLHHIEKSIDLQILKHKTPPLLLEFKRHLTK
jgi:hypothetical protein